MAIATGIKIGGRGSAEIVKEQEFGKKQTWRKNKVLRRMNYKINLETLYKLLKIYKRELQVYLDFYDLLLEGIKKIGLNELKILTPKHSTTSFLLM